MYNTKKMKRFLLVLGVLIMAFIMSFAAACSAPAEDCITAGHNYVAGTCTKCGRDEANPSLDCNTAGHNYVAGTCTKCGRSEASPSLDCNTSGHNYVDGVCTKCGREEPGPDGLGYESNYEAKNMYADNLTRSGNFTADYRTLEDLYAAGAALGEKMGDEGFVLLHNRDNALPLGENEKNVTLLGGHARNPRRSGGGSGSAYNTAAYPAANNATFLSSFENAGYSVNTTVYNAFSSQDSNAIPSETNQLTYASYGDAAIVVFGRGGSEGSDLSPGTPTTAHNLQLTADEQNLVRHAKANFPKVILILNSANVMEMADLVAPKKTDLGVDAIIQVGHIGADSIAALGRLLDGTVNPSGHTVDIWAADLKKGPSYTNAHSMAQNGTDSTRGTAGGAFNNWLYSSLTTATGTQATGLSGSQTTTEYREGIYMGYRFYETVAVDKKAAAAGNGDAWYAENVVFPFGHGLSYTSFKWELDSSIDTAGIIKEADKTVTMKVKVTNIGDMPGKEVVQIYATPPYYNGGIEKSAVNLMGFAKTKLLEPEESDTVTVRFTAQDMASFDWDDKNGNGFKGYELEAGDYIISARSNSHIVEESVTRTVKETILCTTDLMTGKEITPVFSQTEGKLAMYNSTNDSLKNNLLSRAGGLTGEAPKPSTAADRLVTPQFIEDRINTYSDTPGYADKAEDPWYVSQVPTRWTQADAAQVAARVDGKTEIQIQEMAGVPYTNPVVNANGTITIAEDEGSVKWDTFINQMTWEELEMFSISGGWGRRPILSIGKPVESDVDGPCQLNAARNGANARISTTDLNFGRAEVLSTAFPSGTIIASTWNVDITEEEGKINGNFALYANVSGWYAPGVNLHRSPFSGRNFEYFSEDGLLSGKMGGALVRGMTQKGVVCYAKHMFLNDDETNRTDKNTFVTEQTMRELYLKPFELIIKEAGGMGFMTGMNRIGTRACYGNYAFLNVLLRDEFGFKGAICTDADSAGGAQRTNNIKFRAGNDINLGRAFNYINRNNLSTALRNTGEVLNVEPTIWDPTLRGGRGGVKTAANDADRVLAHDAIGDNNTNAGYTGNYENTTLAAGMFTEWRLNHGQWDGLRNKAPAAQYLTVEAATHYYWLRQSVMHTLYNTANSNAVNNNMPSSLMHKDTVFTINVAGTKTGSGSAATVNFDKTNIFDGIAELADYNISATRIVNGLDGIGDFFFTGARVNNGTTSTSANLTDSAAATTASAAGVRMSGGLNGNRFPEGITITATGGLQSITDDSMSGLATGTYELIIKTRLEYWHGISVRLLLTIA